MEGGDESGEGLGVCGGVDDMVGVERFSEGGDVTDGREKKFKSLKCVFGLMEEVKMCESVAEKGDVVVELGKAGEFVGEGEGDASEVFGGEEEGVSVQDKDFLQDGGGGEIESE